MTSPYAARLARTPVRAGELAGARCWTYGEPGGRRMLFLHGLRGDHHGLEPIVAHLPGAEVLVPDLPGFGASAPLTAGRHDVAGYAAWAADALAASGADVLAGHSFGSVVAARVLADARTAGRAAPVGRLVLVNPIATSALAGARPGTTRLTVAFHRLAGALPEPAGTALLRHPAVTRVASSAMVVTRSPQLRRFIHAEHRRWFAGFADRRVLLEAFDASIADDVSRYADALTVPTLLVAGARDDLAPVASQRALAARLPAARLVVLPGTGHLAHYEAPAEVAGAVAGFLAELPT